MAWVTTVISASPLWVVPMSWIGGSGCETMKALLNKYAGRFDDVVAFRPTGWAHVKGGGKGGGKGGKGKKGAGSRGGGGGGGGGGGYQNQQQQQQQQQQQPSVSSFFAPRPHEGVGGGAAGAQEGGKAGSSNGGSGGGVVGRKRPAATDSTRQGGGGGGSNDRAGSATIGEFTCRRSGKCTVYSLPYSEHSSFSELQAAVKAFKPKRIVCTVNVSKQGEMLRLLGFDGRRGGR